MVQNNDDLLLKQHSMLLNQWSSTGDGNASDFPVKTY